MYVNVLQLQHFNSNVYKLYLTKHYVVVNNWKKTRYVLNLSFNLYNFYDSTSSATQETGIVCCFYSSLALELLIYLPRLVFKILVFLKFTLFN
jgi:hypothetical protein